MSIILLLAIGFATITGRLVLGGKSLVSENNNLDIYFSSAELDDIDVSNIVIKDKTHIDFETKYLKNIGDTTNLMYEVTNSSNQYDANVEISCTPMNNEYFNVTLNPDEFIVEAGKIKKGNITIELIKPSTEEKSITLSCELLASAIGRTSVGDDVVPENIYSISGYVVDSEDNPIPSGNYVVYPEPARFVTTDMYGYFHVEGLERGSYEIYYLDTLDHENMTKEEIITSSIANANIATNNKDVIKFSNGYKIVQQLITTEDNKKYDITLDANGGEVGITSLEVEKNKLYGDLPTPTRRGYSFAGWYDGDKLVNKDVYVVKDTPHTLTARWNANSYEITLDSAGGSLNVDKLTVDYDNTIGNLPTPTKENYEFIGWYYNNELVNSNSIYNYDESITLTAKYKQVKFILQNGLISGAYTDTYPLLKRSITINGEVTYTEYTQNAGKIWYLTPGTRVTVRILRGNVNFYTAHVVQNGSLIGSYNTISFVMPARNINLSMWDYSGATQQGVIFTDHDTKENITIPVNYGS